MKKLEHEPSHFLSGTIDEHNVESAIKWIVDLNAKGIGTVCTLYINSDGGSVNDAFALADIMRISKTPISTVAIGSLMSSALLVFAAGFTTARSVSKYQHNDAPIQSRICGQISRHEILCERN